MGQGKDLKSRKIRVKKKFCKYGHDTFIAGRTTNGHCRLCSNATTKVWINAHKEKSKIAQAKWKQENREAYNAYQRNRFHTNLNHKLAHRLRNRISCILKGKVKVASVLKVMGCSLDFLKIYIESQFKVGMSWDNWNKFGWHIDHIIPLDKFDLSDKEQFAKAVHYTNLQPMWAHDNWSKGNRVD